MRSPSTREVPAQVESSRQEVGPEGTKEALGGAEEVPAGEVGIGVREALQNACNLGRLQAQNRSLGWRNRNACYCCGIHLFGFRFSAP
jgi:hypothetical protein